MTDSSPERPSAWVPGAACCQQAAKPDEVGDAGRLHVTAAASAAGGVEPHEQVAGAPPTVGQGDGRTGALQAGQTGPDPGQGQRRPPDRAGGEWRVVHQRLGADRAGHGQVTAHALGQGVVVGDQRVGERPVDGLGHGPTLRGRPGPRDPSGPPVGLEGLEPLEPVRDGSAQDQGQEQVVELVRSRGGVGAPGPAPRPWQSGPTGPSSDGSTGRPAGSPPGPRGPRPRGTGTARVRRSSSGAPSRKVKGRPVRMPWASGEGSADSTQVDVDPTGLHPLEQCDQALGIEGLGQAVGDRLAHQDVVGQGHRSGGGVLLAGGQGRPAGRQQILGLHALEVDGSPLTGSGPGDHQCPVQVPPPAGRQHRVGQDGLGEDLGDRWRCATSWARGTAGSCAGARGRAPRCRRRPQPGARSRRRRRTACAGPVRGPG